MRCDVWVAARAKLVRHHAAELVRSFVFVDLFFVFEKMRPVGDKRVKGSFSATSIDQSTRRSVRKQSKK